MNAGTESTSDAEVERVANVLIARGSTREAAAMLRGAIARDPLQERCARRLAAIVAGGPSVPARADADVEVGFSRVNEWIRRGMLVEALALLGGTPLGSQETGREWANLLGELLAPVPVDAEDVFAQVHRQLLTGGASVALTLLEERARTTPKVPAWAERRLDVLRWMLLDNAGIAEAVPEITSTVPSALADAIRSSLQSRNLNAALEAARAFASSHPGHRDAVRTADALDDIVQEIGRSAADDEAMNMTIPVVGRPAAALQLRMGNLKQGASVYRKMLVKTPDDIVAQGLLDSVQALMRALDGQPVVEDAADLASTNPSAPRLVVDQLATPAAVQKLQIPNTKITRVPEAKSLEGSSTAPGFGGPAPTPAFIAPVIEPSNEKITDQASGGVRRAEELLAEGRLAEAEAIFRGLASLEPDTSHWTQRADEIRKKREARSRRSTVKIRTIKQID